MNLVANVKNENLNHVKIPKICWNLAIFEMLWQCNFSLLSLDEVHPKKIEKQSKTKRNETKQNKNKSSQIKQQQQQQQRQTPINWSGWSF